MQFPPKYGRNEEDEKDDDSLIDKCWVAQYKGDSRKWIIRDGSYKVPHGPLVSTMKEAYVYPQYEHVTAEFVGKRRANLLEKFYNEASAEVILERDAPPPVEEYCTEYDGNYTVAGFQPEKEPFLKYPELYDKYPLYTSIPTTYYSLNLKQNPKPFLRGYTKATDPGNPFKRSSTFAKPLNEVMDDRIL